MLRKYKADIIMLQETKKPVIDRKCFQTLSGSRNRDWIFTLADGSAGAMLIGWKKNQFELLFTEHGLFSLSVKLLDRSSGLQGGSLTSMSLLLTGERMKSGQSCLTLAISLKGLGV